MLVSANKKNLETMRGKRRKDRFGFVLTRDLTLDTMLSTTKNNVNLSSTMKIRRCLILLSRRSRVMGTMLFLLIFLTAVSCNSGQEEGVIDKGDAVEGEATMKLLESSYEGEEEEHAGFGFRMDRKTGEISIYYENKKSGVILSKTIPKHILQLPQEQIFQESLILANQLIHLPPAIRDSLEESKQDTHPTDRRVRERFVLTKFFESVQGTPAMRDKGAWLDPSIDYCEWEGITCGSPDLDEMFEDDDDDDDDEHFCTSDNCDTADDDESDSDDEIREQVHENTNDAYVNDENGSFFEVDSRPPPSDVVTKIELPNSGLKGTLPTELLMLDFLTGIDLDGNRLQGTIPQEYSYLSRIRSLDLSNNKLTGSIPDSLAVFATQLQELFLQSNHFTGPMPQALPAWTNLWFLDLSNNALTGALPSKQLSKMKYMEYLMLGDNLFSGMIPDDIVQLTELRILDFGSNLFAGTLPKSLNQLSKIWDLNFAHNVLSGTFPEELFELTEVQSLLISRNKLTGTLPVAAANTNSAVSKHSSSNVKWSNMKQLGCLLMNHNDLTGTVPAELYLGLKSSLGHLDVSYNNFTGTVAPELGEMTRLYTIDAMGNQLGGSLPDEMLKMNPNLRLNFSDNLITGTIPSMFCGHGAKSHNILYREFGCDAVLCRPGSFNINGHATLHSACRECPSTEEGEAQNPPVSTILGRTTCEGVPFVHGDLDGDGILSQREVLRMLYIDNLGRFWGAGFQAWADMGVHECNLAGITCTKNNIVKIDFTNANICSNGDRMPAPVHFCQGLPAEIGQLTTLEVLQLSRRQFLRGTIPTEIGRLSKLRVLDFSNCPSMSGTLPTELGLLTNLRQLLVSHGHFRGKIPTEIAQLRHLEKLHLTDNKLTGSLPKQIGNLRNVKEFMISRNELKGALPRQIGGMTSLENLEAYGNKFMGTIPSELGKCTNLRRIDLFSCGLKGTIPQSFESIAALQILHLKNNVLTGTIPSSLGKLPYLTWLDLSHNTMHGTIPSSFGSSRSIQDFRLAGNMVYDPIPPGLCSNPNINGGLTKQYACDGVICPLGTYSDTGRAEESSPGAGGCLPCPEGESTLYLGSTTCRPFSDKDILSIFFDVMQGDRWGENFRKNWQDPKAKLCDWSGVVCDRSSGKITGISFPAMGTEDLDTF